jgi:hypothetical protein
LVVVISGSLVFLTRGTANGKTEKIKH